MPARPRVLVRRLALAASLSLLYGFWLHTAAAKAGVPTVPPEAQLLQPATTVTSGPADAPRIALTFDDNYDLPRAYETLDVLERMRVPATVFVIGHYQDLGPALSRRLAAQEDLEIGDHTRSHANCPTLSWRALQIEIGNGTRTFTEITGLPTAPLFRPPGGYTNDMVATAATAQGFRYVVLWDVDTKDWQGASAAAITETVLSQAHNGAIVLMHLAAPHTPEALPGIVSGLRSRGYELVTVGELLRGDRRFADVDPGTAEGATIVRMIDAGYLRPLHADYFGPFDPITRLQLARAAVLAAGLDASDSGPTAGRPAESNEDEPDYTGLAATAGLMTASAVTDRADEPLNRVQLAQVAARMARTKGYAPDVVEASTVAESATAAAGRASGIDAAAAGRTDVPPYAAEDVGLVVDLGLMHPADGERFGVNAAAQRRHVATVLERFLALPTIGESTLLPPGYAQESSGVAAAGTLGGWLARIAPGDRLRTSAAVLLSVLVPTATLAALRIRALRRRQRLRNRRRCSVQGGSAHTDRTQIVRGRSRV